MEVEQLVIKAKKGDDEAFYKLMLNHKEKLYRIALSYLKNEVDAVEAIQETTYRAYKQLKKLKEPKFFSTWLIKILINFCIDEQKHKQKQIVQLQKEEVINEVEPSSKIELERVITKLQPHFQHVVILKYFHDLTVPEIAKVLEKPEGTIKTWLHKALLEMKNRMEREDFYV